MQNRTEGTPAHAENGKNLDDQMHPRWTQDEAIAFACARDYLADLQAAYATALDELTSQPHGDPARAAWLQGELVRLQQQRRDLTIGDQAAVAEVRHTYRARLMAVSR